ncbi:EAL domain-containing protein [Cohnella suwonensis]|uniref:EAL domain-containing protein n=1 Tax=Cohnella suwonensis TaxID=696072 RepID=A0ABW0M197_9BACL
MNSGIDSRMASLSERWANEQGERPASGLFLLRWERGQQVELTGGHRARVRRSLEAIALRLSKVTDTVKQWNASGTTLAMIVTFPDIADGEEGTADAAAGRMAFLLRDVAIRVLTDHRLPAALELGSSLRCGFGWILEAKSDRGARGRMSEKAWESAIMGAYENAWQRLTFAGGPIVRFPLSEMGIHPAEADIGVRYKPIVSLLDGSLYGYEAVPVSRRNGSAIDPRTFYELADHGGRLFESDRKFREAAIRGFPSRNGDVKLFLPVPAKIIYDPRLYPGSTLRRIEAANLRSEHVVLVLVGGGDEAVATAKAALGHYRNQGFRIALPGVQPSVQSLRRMKDLHPDYATIDVGGSEGESIDAIEENLLQALIAIARKEQIVLIAGGLNRDDRLPALVDGGMNYAQGEWIGADHEQYAISGQQVAQAIRQRVKRKYKGASGTLSELASPVMQFGRDAQVSEISRHFELHREEQGIVIAEGGKPIGLLMKEKLHQLLSGQFGLPLYWNRSVGKIMDTHPMIVDESISVDQASQMAMAREPDKLYDAVVITREGIVTGITSIQALLEWVTKTRMADAQWANPLTGLPGNEPIRRELVRRLADGRPFDVLYADLDHFKWYNDHYGFQRGDDVIRYTGEALLEAVKAREAAESFVGHIGGDDFIAICSGTDAEELAGDMIARFERGIAAYVDKGGPVLIEDRSGRAVEATGLSMSLSLLRCETTEGWTPESLSEKAALLKKKAKRIAGNSVVQEWLRLHELTI